MVEIGFPDNDLDEKFHNMIEPVMENSPIQKVIDNQGTSSRELSFSFYILWICNHAYSMRQRKVLNDIEWTGGNNGCQIVFGRER